MEILSWRSYQDYVTSQIITKLNIEHTSFYQTFYSNPNQAVASDPKNAPYAVPLKTADNIFAAETGTGNVYATTDDIFTFFQALLDGKLLSKNSLTELWVRPELAFEYTYAAGLYHNEQSLNGHSVIVGFEPILAFSADGPTGIITLSNYIYPKISKRQSDKRNF